MSVCIYPNCDRPAIYDNMRLCRRHKNYISTYQSSFVLPDNLNETSLPIYCTDTELFNTAVCNNSELYKEDSPGNYAILNKAYAKYDLTPKIQSDK